MRQQAHAIEPRERLAKDRGFLCWDTTQRTAFFPLVLTENWTKGMRKIKCACLQPRGDGIYTIDPRWFGDADRERTRLLAAAHSSNQNTRSAATTRFVCTRRS